MKGATSHRTTDTKGDPMTTNVLVVDDDTLMRTLLQRLLSAEGCNVIQAADGEQALGLLGPDHGIHVVVTDLEMPNMEGSELVRTIRSMERLMALPIIVITGSEEDHQADSLVAGANDYISKPFDPPTLTTKIRNLANLRQIQLEAEKASWTDQLTELSNRRFGDIRLQEEMQRARRYGHPLSVALIDIDHFKLVNDVHGHQVGDDVLIAVAKELRSVSRRTDAVARWGGEEFLFVFPETTSDEAAQIVDRFRAHLAEMSIEVDGQDVSELTVTVSGGVAELRDGDSLETLVERADQGLYRAKETGRNRLMAWRGQQLEPVAS